MNLFSDEAEEAGDDVDEEDDHPVLRRERPDPSRAAKLIKGGRKSESNKAPPADLSSHERRMARLQVGSVFLLFWRECALDLV